MVTRSHLHCKCAIISETVQNGVVMIYRSDIWPIKSSNSDDLEWPTVSFAYCKLFQMWIFLYSCAAVDKISTDAIDDLVLYSFCQQNKRFIQFDFTVAGHSSEVSLIRVLREVRGRISIRGIRI